MKDNSLKILWWLYSDSLQPPMTSNYEQLSWVLPEITPAGLRSLVRHLVQAHLVRSELVNQRSELRLTSHGQRHLVRSFSALSQAVGLQEQGWSCLVCLQAPAADRGFRYLRTQLLENQALQLTRGVYLFWGELPPVLEELLQKMYVGAVTVFRLAEWLFGDERSVVVDAMSLSAVNDLYSGLSTEINELLGLKNSQKGSGQTFKTKFYSVFDRLFVTLRRDSGLTQRYFPHTIKPTQLLAQLQQLAFLP